jgi:putative ABC transport system permease protein
VFPVVGLAVSAADYVYPWAASTTPPADPSDDTGMIWLTEADVRALSAGRPPAYYVLDLRLARATSLGEFLSPQRNSTISVYFATWQDIAAQDARILHQTDLVLNIGAWLLGFLAIVSVVVLAAARAAQQTRQVGLLKAVGAGPGLVAAVLLARYLILGLVAAILGLLAGWLAAPAFSDPSGGLVGAISPPASGTVEPVAILALAAAILTTFAPAFRAAGTSTIRALADSPRPPRRSAMTALLLRLPVPLMLGMQLTFRRPFRAALHAGGIAATVTVIAAMVTYYAQPARGYYLGGSTLTDLQNGQGRRAIFMLAVVLGTIACVNVIVITWTTALETRRPLAIARTLGLTPDQAAFGIGLAQILPALPGVMVGIPVGIGLYAINDLRDVRMPSAGWILIAVVAIVLAVAVLTAITARIAARNPVAGVLSSEAR